MKAAGRLLILVAALVFPCGAGRMPEGAPEVFQTAVPAHTVDVILGRPTAGGVTASVLAYRDARVFIAYGTARDALTDRTGVVDLAKGEPQEIRIDSLRPDTLYHYQLRTAAPEAALEPGAPVRSFHTQRPPGRPFVFTITADSHLDDRTNLVLLERTLANALAGGPDFHIDLGDTFMTEKHAAREDAAKQYLAQRFYFGEICRSAPLFLVLGNHDGEGSRTYDGTAESMAVWSAAMRNRYFPNPVPDSFYTGNAIKDRFAGLLQDYYAWQWGDALFVVLDPFWYASRPRGGGDNWARTLGFEQYRWLKRTLEESRARHKFVFIHHLVGGIDQQDRGGTEAAPFYEWGGKNADGSDGFSVRRPGWDTPIHPLLLKNGVTAVFHGHDHFFCRQELDGIAYALVPQPGLRNPRGRDMAREYGYLSGTLLPSAGHLRVTVSPQVVRVEYVRSYLPKDVTPEHPDGEIAFSCEIAAPRPVAKSSATNQP